MIFFEFAVMYGINHQQIHPHAHAFNGLVLRAFDRRGVFCLRMAKFKVATVHVRVHACFIAGGDSRVAEVTYLYFNGFMDVLPYLFYLFYQYCADLSKSINAHN